MGFELPDNGAHAGAGAPAAEPMTADSVERGSRRLAAVLARCRTGLENYGARRKEWWRQRLSGVDAAARRSRSLAFGRKGKAASDQRT
jgi:hypothetical protein